MASRVHQRTVRVLFPVMVLLLAAPLSAEPVVGEPVEIGQFAGGVSGDGFVGVAWDSPRDVYEVGVSGVEQADNLHLEWWGSVWPANGSGGWMQLDDPWNGRWVRVDAKAASVGPAAYSFRLPPLGKAEWDKALKDDDYADKKSPAFRRTLKIRIVADGAPLPQGLKLRIYSNSRWATGTFDVQTRQGGADTAAPRIEVVNGALTGIGIEKLDTSTRTRVHIFYADNSDLNSNDLTRVTVRLRDGGQAAAFSFTPQDVLREGCIRLPDFDATVTDAARGAAPASGAGPTRKWDKRVRLRVADRPEMTRVAAMEGIPRLAPAPWVPLGVPSARQEFFIGPNGDWAVWGASLHTKNARDYPRLRFRKNPDALSDELYALLDTRSDPAFDGKDRRNLTRFLHEGFLPIIHAEWDGGPLHYRHTLFCTTLAGDYADDVTRRGDETVAILTRLHVSNPTTQPQTAIINLRFSHSAPIALDPDGLVRIVAEPSTLPADTSAVRALVSGDRLGASGWALLPPTDPQFSHILRWQGTVEPGKSAVLFFKAPFVDLLDPSELDRLKGLSFEQELPRIVQYWRDRLAKDMLIDVPDEALNNFYRANLWHNCITTDRDPETGLYNQGVGTVRYRVFANETVMIARSMDMRGEHVEAGRFIEPMLHYQGAEPLKGRFSTQEGVFHSAGPYTHGEYAMNHGFVLWGIADHYLMTRDRAYLDRVAGKLVAGCDFLINERTATMGPPGQPRSPIHGLAPASSLEDVVEYQYWFATNAYFHLGLKRAAQALADISHPQAARIAAEADKYRRDIEIAAREAAARAAVVPLRDGTWIPYVPSRVYQWRHLTEGWIREALYPSLHLATGEVVEPDDHLITWMLDDLEDNIFFSWQSGYNVSDFEQRWFEKGGITLQPCLLDTPIIYMARDEIPAALRAFWNTYALSIYPDVHCFAEWARRFGQPGGPLYKTSDESRFVMWLRQLLIWEDGDTLYLCRAAPRQWLEHGKTIRIENAPTMFGPMSLTIRSEVADGRITARLTLPARNRPGATVLRLRHPQGLSPKRVLVNDRPLSAAAVRNEDVSLSTDMQSANVVTLVAEY